MGLIPSRCAFIGVGLPSVIICDLNMLSLVVSIAAVVFVVYVAFVLFWSENQETGHGIANFFVDSPGQCLVLQVNPSRSGRTTPD